MSSIVVRNGWSEVCDTGSHGFADIYNIRLITFNDRQITIDEKLLECFKRNYNKLRIDDFDVYNTIVGHIYSKPMTSFPLILIGPFIDENKEIIKKAGVIYIGEGISPDGKNLGNVPIISCQTAIITKWLCKNGYMSSVNETRELHEKVMNQICAEIEFAPEGTFGTRMPCGGIEYQKQKDVFEGLSPLEN